MLDLVFSVLILHFNNFNFSPRNFSLATLKLILSTLIYAKLSIWYLTIYFFLNYGCAELLANSGVGSNHICLINTNL